MQNKTEASQKLLHSVISESRPGIGATQPSDGAAARTSGAAGNSGGASSAHLLRVLAASCVRSQRSVLFIPGSNQTQTGTPCTDGNAVRTSPTREASAVTGVSTDHTHARSPSRQSVFYFPSAQRVAGVLVSMAMLQFDATNPRSSLLGAPHTCGAADRLRPAAVLAELTLANAS